MPPPASRHERSRRHGGADPRGGDSRLGILAHIAGGVPGGRCPALRHPADQGAAQGRSEEHPRVSGCAACRAAARDLPLHNQGGLPRPQGLLHAQGCARLLLVFSWHQTADEGACVGCRADEVVPGVSLAGAWSVLPGGEDRQPAGADDVRSHDDGGHDEEELEHDSAADVVHVLGQLLLLRLRHRQDSLSPHAEVPSHAAAGSGPAVPRRHIRQQPLLVRRLGGQLRRWMGASSSAVCPCVTP
eukprot:scaffold207_cov409-Prasinococcus_capsulatus_cf.AAC.143